MMAAPLSRNSYIAELRQKYDVKLPQAIKAVERKMSDLKQLHNQILNERHDLGLEIDFLKRSWSSATGDRAKVNLLMDIPQSPWTKIVQLCGSRDYTLLNACAASNCIEKRVTRDCPGVKELMITKKAMEVLVKNHYLDKEDLLNCFKSNSQNLEICAAGSFRYLKNAVEYNDLRLNDTRSILQFVENAKRQENIWDAFIGKDFKFDCGNLKTMDEHQEYLFILRKFLDDYGKCIFRFETANMDQNGCQEILFKNLIYALPNIQYFKDSPTFEVCIERRVLRNFLDEKNRRTFDPEFQIFGGMRIGNSGPFFETLGLQANSIDRLFHRELASFCKPKMQTGWMQKIKVLELYLSSYIPGEHKIFLEADLDGFVSLEKLRLLGTRNYLEALTMLAHKRFQLVREIVLICRDSLGLEPTWDSPPPQFLSVKKLTLQLQIRDVEPPPRVDEIADVFPSLHYFRLRFPQMDQSQLQSYLKEWKGRGSFLDHNVDLYDFYTDGKSLSRSNIWRYMANLKTLIVETVAEYLEGEQLPGNDWRRERGVYTNRSEIYTRKDRIICFKQETVLAD